MSRLFLLFILIILFASCKKAQVNNNDFSEATYRLQFTGKWISPLGIPSGAHFTTFAGAVHQPGLSLWKEQTLASRSLQYVAENGYVIPMLSDIDSLIGIKKALAPIVVSPPAVNAQKAFNVYANSNYPCISFASMIAPSPDWFAGLSQFNLYANGKWISDTTLQLYVYDAGTKDGDDFSYNFPATQPQQFIHALTPASGMALANGLTTLPPIAEIRIVRQ